MNTFIQKLWSYRKVSTIIAIALILGATFLELNVYVLGIYLLSGWLFTPLVTYWLLGEHDLPISFTVRVYPIPIRNFIAYGWFIFLFLLSFVWVLLLFNVNAS